MHRLLQRARVALTAPRLESELAAGVAPEVSPHHTLRARQLTAPRSRAHLAGSWERLLARAYGEEAGGVSPVLVRRARIQHAAPEIRALIAALRASGPVPAQGAAIAARLLRDGRGPLYDPRASASLRELIARAVEHLDPALPLTSGLVEAARD